MSTTRNDDVNRILELLADEATFGLGVDEQDLLRSMPRDLGGLDRDELMRVAGLAQLSFLRLDSDSYQEMPVHLREKVAAQAQEFFAGKQSRPRAASVTPITDGRHDDRAARREPLPANRGPRFDLRSAGWYLAAALALVFVLVRPATMTPGTPGATSMAERRAELLAEPNTLRAKWKRSEFPRFAEVTGDVIWSDADQAGYMRLAGLPANDPAIEQYQLWIVDPDRDQHPVDGGVFDIPRTGGEVLIPIDAKLPVSSPAAFAITLEKPGGVVVSDGPLLIVAATG